MGVVDTHSKGNYKFGIVGESFVEFFSNNMGKDIPDELKNDFKQKYGDLSSHNLEYYVKFWFKHITNEEISHAPIAKTNKYVLTYGNASSYDRGIRAVNTGSGLSFVIPIIVTCIGAVFEGAKPTVIIENPENHLHPIAQIKLTEFLLFMSKHIQVIVETHSDHVLKESMQKGNKKCQMIICKIEDNETKITILEQSNFKISPIAYSEVQHRAFGLYTQDLHENLLSHIQEQHGFGTKAMEGHFYSNCSARCGLRKWIGGRNNKGTIVADSNNDAQTLPLYIRHYIHHPECRCLGNAEFTSEELRQSINFMLNYIENGFS